MAVTDPGTFEENLMPSDTEAVSFVTSRLAGTVEFVQNDVWPITAVQSINSSAAATL
jgi:hypothetical protein